LNEGIIQRLTELQDLLSAQPAVSPAEELSTATPLVASTQAEASGEKNVVATLESWLDNINRRR
jgi:hypothetical protein